MTLKLQMSQCFKMKGVVVLQVFLLPSEVQKYNAFGLVYRQIIKNILGAKPR